MQNRPRRADSRGIATGTKDNAGTRRGLDVSRGNQSTSRVVDERDQFGRHVLFRLSEPKCAPSSRLGRTDKFLEGLLEHFGNVVPFDVGCTEAFCPSEQHAVIDAFLAGASKVIRHWFETMRDRVLLTCKGN